MTPTPAPMPTSWWSISPVTRSSVAAVRAAAPGRAHRGVRPPRRRRRCSPRPGPTAPTSSLARSRFFQDPAAAVASPWAHTAAAVRTARPRHARAARMGVPMPPSDIPSRPTRSIPESDPAACAHVGDAVTGARPRPDVPRPPGADVRAALPAFFVPVFNSDETFLATQAHVIGDGGQLYEDAIDRKPPLVPVRVRGDVLVLRDHRAVVGARGRDARGRAHRTAARGRGAPAIRHARGLDRRRAVRVRDGRVRAPRRPGRELRSVHAAVDDGGDPVRAPRARASPRARWSPPRRWPSRPARPRCSRSSTSSHARAASAASARSRSASRCPTALVALAVGPAQLLYWAVLGNGSYVGVEHRVDGRASPPSVHDRRLGGVQPAIAVEAPERVARSRRARRSTARRDTDLWLWVVSAAVSGRDRPALLRPLLHAARPAARAARGRRAVAQAAETLGERDRRRDGLLRDPLLRRPATSCAPVFGGEPKYETCQRVPRQHNATPTTRSSCGAASPRSTGLRGCARPRGSSPRTFLTGNHPGATPTSRGTSATPIRQMWEYFYEDFTRAPAAVHPRHLTGQGARRRALPDLRVPRLRLHHRRPVPLRAFDRRGRRSTRKRHTSGQGVER